MGISINLLLAERPSMDQYTDVSLDPANKWQQPPPPPPPYPNHTPRDRDRGPFFADYDEFHPSEILAMVSSALNLLVATAL
jgi:hypothetical protein